MSSATMAHMSTTQSKNSRCQAYVNAAPYASIFSTVPSGDTAGTEISGGTPAYARKALSWSAPSNGVSTATATFDIPSGAAAQAFGYHSAATAGTYFDGGALSASQTFSAQGTLTVTFTHTES